MFNYKVRDYLHLGVTPGDVGLEIEMEVTKKVDPLSKYPGWYIEGDGSLRGIGYEFILKKPLSAKNVNLRIKQLKKNLDDQGVKIIPSIRAGVHIHLNMQDKTFADVYRFLCCYYPLETVLLNWCGQGRQGNLFCLSGRDAIFQHECLRDSALQEDIYILRTDSLRYSAMNLQSLFSFGSLEFRALGTDPDLEKISPLIDILTKLKEYACNSVSPWQNLVNISGMGPKSWMESVLGEEITKSLSYPSMEEDIIADTREVQMLCSVLKRGGV